MKLDPFEIIDLLTEENFLQLTRKCGHDKEYVVDAVLKIQKNQEIRLLAEYMAMENKLGIGSKEVQILMREIMNSQFERKHENTDTIL